MTQSSEAKPITERVVVWAMESAKAVAGSVGGAVVGLLVGWYGRAQAHAAVAVRPNLADVDFISAVLTNHGIDWLFYHYSMVLIVVLVALFGFWGFIAGAKA